MTHTTKHTPGPWVVKSTDENRNTKTIIDSNEFWIAKVLNFNRVSDDIRESQANANLIAAAPAMYAALREAEKHLTDLANYGSEGIPEPLLVSVRSAIAQAEGE